ncbi:MAG: hypothetical protein IPP17_14865 [Bacteroidetes bacterium]|nr:hypothetical protein [Bacteroidota bacterium]
MTTFDSALQHRRQVIRLAISSADLPVCSINLPVHPPGCPFIQFGVLEILSVAPLPQRSQEVGPIPEDVLPTVMANRFYSPQNAFLNEKAITNPCLPRFTLWGSSPDH